VSTAARVNGCASLLSVAPNGMAAWRRGASTTFVAGDKRSITHKIFRGVTAPLAPNRSLAVRPFM